MAFSRIDTTSQSRAGARRSAGNNAICLDCPALDLDRHAALWLFVDLSKIKHLPLNHAAIMNAPVFDNRPCPMVLVVLAANLGAQKHDADSRFDHGPARHLDGLPTVWASSPCRLTERST